MLDRLLWSIERRLLERRARRPLLHQLAAVLGSGDADPLRTLRLCLDLGLLNRARQAARRCSAVPTGEALQLAWMAGDFDAFDRLANDAACAAGLAAGGHAAQNRGLALIAQREPGLALRLVRAMPNRPLCAPAIALRAGEPAWARRWRAMPRWRLHADYLLIDANLAAAPAERMAALNRYLARHGLAPLALVDPAHPPSVRNFRTARTDGRPADASVSIVVPAHDNADHIRASIASLEAQTLPPREIIVVDDASSDATTAIVAAAASANPAIRLLRLPANVGAYAARNAGLAAATSTFVCFHDADDFAHPQRLERAIGPMLADASVQLTSSRCVRIDDAGHIGEARAWPLTRWTPISLAARRQALLQTVGGFELRRFGADSEYAARARLLLGERHHRLVPEPLAFFAQRNDSLTTSGPAAFGAQGFSAARIAYQEEWTERHLANLTTPQRLKQPLPDREDRPDRVD